MDKKSMAPSAYRYGYRRSDRRAPSILAPTRASGATRYNMQSSLGSHCIPGSLPAWLYLRRGAVSAMLVLFTGLHCEPRIPNPKRRPSNKAQAHGNCHSQHQPVDRDDETVHDQNSRLERTRREDPSSLSVAWASSTAATYGNTIRRHFDFCEEHRLAPLAATPAHMARYVAWLLGQLGTIKASSLQPYPLAVNGFKDYGLEAVALGGLVAKVRKGLAASHVAIKDTLVRVHVPTSIVAQAPRVALRHQLRVRSSKPSHHATKYNS
jgi:hypothetical protein